MEKKKVEIEKSVTVAGATVILVTEVSMNCWHRKSSISFFGVKRPVNVVLVSPSAERAFRITGEEIPLDHLLQEVPDIREVLERCH